ncbi:MAG: gamma-glutamyltransferase [Wenzhouxiangellaceae bacterium]|nr:gamma-glutamyltransferase [Wenzhouxiangellaceae bacterium]
MTDSIARVASGHPQTTAAAAAILEAGGNAVDALLAAAWSACVAEPIFCSPGGGGCALLRLRGRSPQLLDFFTQTPRARRLDGIDFYPIQGNFGTDVQEFHVGMASVAVPGMVAGLFELHRRYASMPMSELAAPATELARNGVELNAAQALALVILEPIVTANAESARIFGLQAPCSALPGLGDRIVNRDLARCIEELACRGPDLFYRGEIAAAISAMSARGGGHLRPDDLSGYRVAWRRPIKWRLGEVQLWSNPPPAFGGLMVALMTRALERRLSADAEFGSPAHLDALIGAMRESENRRLELERPETLRCDRLLMRSFEKLVEPKLETSKGTTHISISDAAGNLAGMTLTNGEGCARAVPGCGFMLNNMLGEQDLNRLGFHNWPTNRRLSSMIAPTLLSRHGRLLMLGSGGSNRIRTAIAQVVCNMMHFDMGLDEAIRAPRVHLEGMRLSLEIDADFWPPQTASWLEDQPMAEVRRWPPHSLYFGGVQAVSDHAAAADPRRGGTVWQR